MEGGPPLPIVEGSVFYYLFVLLILIFASSIFFTLKVYKKIFAFLGISVAIASVLYFEIVNLGGDSLPYWRIDNFMIYIPLSYFILSKQKQGILTKYIPFFYILFLLFSAHDIYLRHYGYFCHFYSRISIIFGSLALFSSILQIKNMKQRYTINLLAKYSLGIFAVHKYWQLITTLTIGYFGFTAEVYAASFPLDLYQWNIAVLTMVFTFFMVFLGSHTFLNKYLT